MNQQIFDTAYTAYQSGNWAEAASAFAQCKAPGEVAGRVDHLRGNALMQIGSYDQAADAYAEALADPSYGMIGALCTNRGRALLAAGRVPEAISSLEAATQDSSYATPYKAYMALAGAYRSRGDARSAGIAYRNAAIDEHNPNPCLALRKLGACFMDLGRSTDAIESYRTALDFTTSAREKNPVYCELALAYVAANRMNEAVDAFEHATADGTYKLSAEAQAAYDAACNAVAALERRRAEAGDPSSSSSYASLPLETLDPLDPTGATSADLMPSPEDTGFFSVSEEELLEVDRRGRKGHGRKVLVAILVILLLLGAAGGFAYYSGFGWPTQESVVKGLFDAKTNHDDTGKFVSSTVDEEGRQKIASLVPSGATVNITGVNRSMSSSEVLATATLAEGGDQNYEIKLVRDGIGWKITEFTPQFVSIENTTATSEQPAQQTQQQQQAQPAQDAPQQQPAAEAQQQPAAEAAPAEGAADADVTEGTVSAE